MQNILFKTFYQRYPIWPEQYYGWDNNISIEVPSVLCFDIVMSYVLHSVHLAAFCKVSYFSFDYLPRKYSPKNKKYTFLIGIFADCNQRVIIEEESEITTSSFFRQQRRRRRTRHIWQVRISLLCDMNEYHEITYFDVTVQSSNQSYIWTLMKFMFSINSMLTKNENWRIFEYRNEISPVWNL